MDTQDATAELYAAPPAGFVARRAELAAQARQAGAPEVAKALTALRRPTVAAWLVNLLRVDRPAGRDDAGRDDAGPGLAPLVALGTQVRAAQAALDGPRIRELTRQRQAMVAALVLRAAELAEAAGHPAAPAVQREIEQTLTAAVADQRAAEAVCSGRLTRALLYAGIGDVDTDSATAAAIPITRNHQHGPARIEPTRAAPAPARTQPARTQPARTQPARTQPAEDPQTRAERAREVEARAAVDRARAELAVAEQDEAVSRLRHEQAAAAEQALHDRVERLQAELADARRELIAAGQNASAAARSRQRRERDTREARAAVQRAQRLVDD